MLLCWAVMRRFVVNGGICNLTLGQNLLSYSHIWLAVMTFPSYFRCIFIHDRGVPDSQQSPQTRFSISINMLNLHDTRVSNRENCDVTEEIWASLAEKYNWIKLENLFFSSFIYFLTDFLVIFKMWNFGKKSNIFWYLLIKIFSIVLSSNFSNSLQYV